MFHRHYIRDRGVTAPRNASRRSSAARLVAVVLLVAAMPAAAGHVDAQSQAPVADQIYHDFWGSKEGAPALTQTLAQTSDGLLWLGTPAGLYRFDGNRFEAFQPMPGEQLLSNDVMALIAPKTGGLWVGYLFGGFSFVKDRHVQHYLAAVRSGTVLEFAQSQDGEVWAVTNETLWRFNGSNWEPVSVKGQASGSRFLHAGFDRSGNLWVISTSGLLRLEPNRQQFEFVTKDVPSEFTVDADGAVETRDTRAEAPTPGDKHPTTYPVFGRNAAGIVDRANSVWVGSNKPVVVRLPAADWLSGAIDSPRDAGDEAYKINPYWNAKLVDREGNVWFGGPSGIDRLRHSPLIKQQLPAEAEDEKTGNFAIAASEDGSVWIAERATELHAFLCHVMRDRVEVRPLPNGSEAVAYSAPDNTLWFGGFRALTHVVGHGLSKVDLPPALADQWFFLQTITQDDEGGLWVSFGRHGLYRLANGIWTSKGGHNDLPDGGVVIEYTDSLRRIWFGYLQNKLAVLDNDHVRVFGPEDGVHVGNIKAIDGRGSHVWIGGEFGLQHYDQGHLSNIEAVNDEWLRGIAGIVETATGDLWLYAVPGIFHIGRSEIDHALQDPAYRVRGEHFGRRQGAPGQPEQLRPLRAAIQGSDGRIWFAGSDGVAWIDPAKAENRVPPPPTAIQSISADGRFYSPHGDLHFPAHTSDVQFAYSAISLSDPEAVRYRYKLDETDRDWHEVSTASPVTYRNLGPGPYHFRVTASDLNGLWSDKAATVAFSIRPALYQTGWFYLLCGLSGLALIFVLYRMRLRQVAAQVRNRMEARLAERERIARDLHDTLLQSVQGLIMRFQAVADRMSQPDPARELMERTLKRADQVLDESRDRVQGLRASRAPDLPEAIATEGEQLAIDYAIQFRASVEGVRRELHPIVREETGLIAREALRNAFRHSGARRVESEVSYDDAALEVRIRDDGQGIDPGVLNRGGAPGHFGLLGMRERATRIRAELSISGKAGAGTEVGLRVPAKVAYKSSCDTPRRTRWGRDAS
jgi:signal transduction histidine kinase/ligand-binding sensor domain-containing protein